MNTAAFFLLTTKIKKMEESKTQMTSKFKEKLEITQIKNTPFNYAQRNNEKYIICGKVILETEKTIEETEKWLKQKPWEAISLLCQAITNEIINDKKQ